MSIDENYSRAHAQLYQTDIGRNPQAVRRDPFCKYFDDKPTSDSVAVFSLSSAPAEPPRPLTPVQKAMAFLKEVLAGGAVVHEREVKRLATERGIGIKTMRRAAGKLGIRMGNGIKQVVSNQYYWSLPKS
jgi:hypothetical protein